MCSSQCCRFPLLRPPTPNKEMADVVTPRFFRAESRVLIELATRTIRRAQDEEEDDDDD